MPTDHIRSSSRTVRARPGLALTGHPTGDGSHSTRLATMGIFTFGSSMPTADRRVGSTTQAGRRACPDLVARRALDLLHQRAGGRRTRPLARVRGRSTSERLIRGASGPFACESNDGKDLLFQPRDADSPLMAMPLTGGEARQLVACVRNSAFCAGPHGVYYVACDSGSNPQSTSSICKPDETSASARSRGSPFALWVWLCRPTGRPLCTRETCRPMPT